MFNYGCRKRRSVNNFNIEILKNINLKIQSIVFGGIGSKKKIKNMLKTF